MDFFDRNGRPIAYIRKGYLLSWNGLPLAHVQNDAVYTLTQKHVGYLNAGWIIDRKGDAVAFSENCGKGPMTPLRIEAPLKPLAPLPPVAPQMTLPALRPIQTMNWSPNSLNALLE